MNILVIINGLVPPAVEMTGLKALYDLQKEINNNPRVNLYILTSSDFWTDSNYEEWVKRQEKIFNFKIQVVDVRRYNNILLELIVSRLKFLYRIYKITKENKIDLIHDYSSNPLLFFFDSLVKIFTKKPIIHTICTVNKGSSKISKLNLGRFVDRIICTSPDSRDKFIKERPRLKEKTIYLPIGLDSEPFLLGRVKDLNIINDKKIILYIGPLEERKGVFVFTKAIKEVLKRRRDVFFLFATYGKSGVDPKNKENELKVRQLLRGQEEYFQILKGKHDIPVLMASAHIFVLPIVDIQGTLAQPLTLLEAMVSKKIIIASDIPSVTGIIKDKESGFLFKANDSFSLSGKIIWTLEHYSMVQSAAHKAQKDALAKYDIKITSKNVISFYEELLKYL